MATVKKRISNKVTNTTDINYLLSLKEEDITSSCIMNLFGEFDGKRKFQPFDIIQIPAGRYGGKIKSGKEKINKKPITTTIGRLIFNKYFFEGDPELLELFGYVNKSINKKTYGSIFDELGYMLLEDKVSVDTYKKFCLKTQKFMPFVTVLAYNHSDNMLTITKQLDVRKNQLMKKYEKEIAEGDIYTVDKISNELMDYARELMKDDPAMDMFNSGAGGSFENNFKNMFIMRGSVKDPDPTKGYNIIFSSFIDGISKEDYAKVANSLAAGPYARSKKTESGGYWEKLFMSAFQHIQLLEEGSDCGTKRTIEINVDSKNIKDIMYCYVVERDKLTEITYENMNRFVGKKIRIRFSSMCEAKNGICNKCAGNLFYRLGIKNVGAATPQIPSRFKNICMKSFHDDQLNFTDMDIMKAFSLD